MTLILDSGVWIASIKAGEAHFEASRSLVGDLDRPLAALDLTLYEVANVVGALLGRPRDAEALAQLVEKRCRSRISTVDSGLVRPTLRVAAEHGLSGYDAAYVAVARRNGWQLVSTDLRDLVSKGLAVTPDAAV